MKTNKHGHLYVGDPTSARKFCRICAFKLCGEARKLDSHYETQHPGRGKGEWLAEGQQPEDPIYSNWHEFLQSQDPTHFELKLVPARSRTLKDNRSKSSHQPAEGLRDRGAATMAPLFEQRVAKHGIVDFEQQSAQQAPTVISDQLAEPVHKR